MRTCRRCGAPLKNGECEYCGEKEENAAKISKNDAERARVNDIFTVRCEMHRIEKELKRCMVAAIAALLLCLAGIGACIFGIIHYDIESVSVEYEIEEASYEIRGGVE